MKKFRSLLCLLLGIAMILVFCACEKEEKPEEVSTAPTQGAQSPTPTEPVETPTPSAPVETAGPSDDMVARPDLIITSMEDFENRPRGIQPGTVLNYLAGADIPSQLPWNCGPEAWFWTNVFEGLLYNHFNDPTDIRGCVAETWEHSDDYLTWTFHIRDGIKFHDGTDCDANAIEASFTYYQQASPPTLPNYNITSWEATDAKTFVLHLSAPCPFLEVGISSVLILSPTALDLYGIADNMAAIGTGPYYIDSYSSGVGVVLKANTGYYLDEKMPCIEKVNFQIINDSNTAVMALINGDLDGGVVRAVEGYYNLKDSNYDGALVPTYDVGSAFWFNAKKVPEFQTLEVRKAMSRFIDWPGVNTLVYDDLGLVQDALWTPGTTGYVPFDQNYYDPAEGLELLASVGVEPQDIKFSASIVDAYKDIFVSIQNELQKVDVTMEVEAIEAAANFTLLMNGDWTVSVGSFGYTNTSPWAPWTFILKPDAMCKMCWQDVYDPELYQTMLDEFTATTTATTWDDMMKHLKQLTSYQQDDFGAIGAVQAPIFVVLSSDFKSGVFTSESHAVLVYYMYK